jgi:eukaryotic-like serine/threonine-protein kinase
VETAALSVELADVNRRRLRVLAPVMALVHTAHVALFHVSAQARATLPAEVVRWRDGLVVAHSWMIAFCVVGGVLAWRVRSPVVARALGPATAIAYLVHGAVCTGLDQIVVSNVTAYVGYCIAIAVMMALTPLVALVAYAIGAATLVTMMVTLQHSSAARLSSLPNCATITVVGVAFSWILYAARRREFAHKLTIDCQQQELNELNASLERRVAEQVAQLQAQVVARSSELSKALARLGNKRGADTMLARGAVLGGRFVVGEIIGEGGMSTVYAGVDRSSGARVAIKVIQALSSRQLDVLRRFIREAGATATLTHPAIVRMLHVDVSDDGMLFQVQELVAGETLTRRLVRAWPPGEAARLGAVLADALGAAHAQGVVHRDVKPDNIMLTTTAPGLKLLDFGIAKLYDAVSGGEETTRGGLALGTPAYMAPEQVSGDEIGDRADVYAVGLILFRLLAARGPFEASSPHEMMMRHVLATPPELRSIDPSLPEPLSQLVARCLDKVPPARPTAAALAVELAAFADAAEAPRLEKLAARSPADPTVRARA